MNEDFKALNIASQAMNITIVNSELIRKRESSLWRCGENNTILARVSNSGSCANRIFETANLLSKNKIPTPNMIGGPCKVGDKTVLFMEWCEPNTNQTVTEKEIGGLLKRMHNVTPTSLTPDFCPAGRPTEALNQIKSPYKEKLEAIWKTIQPGIELAKKNDPLGYGLIHGDFHEGNILRSDNIAHIIDLESSGKGPKSYDLCALLVQDEFYQNSNFDKISKAYEHDIKTWNLYRHFVLWHAWVLTVGAVKHEQASIASHEEAKKRLKWWTTGEFEKWEVI